MINGTTQAIPARYNFSLLVIGQAISVFGSALLRFALSLYVLDTTGSEALFAALFAISNIPLLLAPLGGAIADRFNRKYLMVIYDFTNSTIVLSLIFLMGTGNITIPAIGIIMVFLSVLGAFETPTVTACIPTLTVSDKLESANGIVQAVQALSGIAAPILGGIIYGFFGVLTLSIFSCAAFFFAAVMEMFIKLPFAKRKQDRHILFAFIKDLKDGFAYVVKEPFILKAITLAAMLNFVLTPLFMVGAPIILRFTMSSGDTMYGVGMGTIQIATIAGAVLTGFFAKKMRVKTIYRWLLTTTLLVIPMAISITPAVLGFGYIPTFIIFMASAIPIAAALTIISVFAIAKVQKKTPDEHLGKVMAIVMAVAQCAAPLGQIVYGFVFEAFSHALYLPLMAVSGLMLLVTLISKKMLRNEGEPL